MDWDERVTDSDGFGRGARQVAAVLGTVFAVTLTVVVGKQMSSEAISVVVGVVCGVVAGIPTSMLLLVVLTRREQKQVDEVERVRQGDYPPVVVVQGSGGTHGLPQGSQAGYWPAPMPGPSVDRQFQVVGGDDLLLDERRY